MRILLLCALVAAACASSWNYDVTDTVHGPANWPDECVKTTSQSQSPIDIITGTAVDASYSSFSFSGYGSVNVELTNNGHSVKAKVLSTNPQLTGGGLSGTYKLAQFHIHWGSTNSQGSEHMLDGVQFPMEVHFVHYNSAYSSLGDAADESDGLAVLAWFFKIGSSNSDWNTIFSELPLAEDATVNINNLDLEDLMGDDDDFYRYQGSLTTPPCYESVTWTVFEDEIEISQSQMDVVRSVVDEHNHHISNNFRPTQQLNGRTISKS